MGSRSHKKDQFPKKLVLFTAPLSIMPFRFQSPPRKFDNRMGDDTKVFLGLAELGAVAAAMGKLSTPAGHLAVYKEKIESRKDVVYRYLQFDQMKQYQ
jgi:aconitate hydratase 2/2-methylisocitrate dehydratase